MTTTAEQADDYIPCLLCGRITDNGAIHLFKAEVFAHPEAGFSLFGLCPDCGDLYDSRSAGFFRAEDYDAVCFTVHVVDDIERLGEP